MKKLLLAFAAVVLLLPATSQARETVFRTRYEGDRITGVSASAHFQVEIVKSPEIKAVALMTYDPGNPTIYVQGQVVFHDGSFYYVGEDNPSGIPDTSEDFTLIEWGSTYNYDVDNASNYQQGQIITDGDNVYLVAKDKPEGTPGSSDDYVPLYGDIADLNILRRKLLDLILLREHRLKL